MSMRTLAHAAAVAAVMASSLGAEAPLAASGNRSVVSLPDGRYLALVGARSQSMSSVNGDFHIVADGITIEFVDGKLSVDGAARAVPDFNRVLEIRIEQGEVVLTADP